MRENKREKESEKEKEKRKIGGNKSFHYSYKHSLVYVLRWITQLKRMHKAYGQHKKIWRGKNKNNNNKNASGSLSSKKKSM